MEPILPEPTAPNAVPQNQEAGPVMPSVESSPNTAPEQGRESMQASAAPTIQAATHIAPQPLPTAPPTVSNPSAQAAPLNDNPVIADDVDVIEKEWVDKARRIVNATKEDPYAQEKEVSKLQADYLMKRYNKQVKLPE